MVVLGKDFREPSSMKQIRFIAESLEDCEEKKIDGFHAKGEELIRRILNKQ